MDKQTKLRHEKRDVRNKLSEEWKVGMKRGKNGTERRKRGMKRGMDRRNGAESHGIEDRKGRQDEIKGGHSDKRRKNEGKKWEDECKSERRKRGRNKKIDTVTRERTREKNRKNEYNNKEKDDKKK